MVRTEHDPKIELRAREVLAELGRPDRGVSAKQTTLAEKGPGGNYGLHESAGTWEISLSDGTTYDLPLTFEELYDAGIEKSEKLKAVIARCISRRRDG
jgi:hypothetical protein